ncbi:hypothetical protein [Lysinibacillus fusiformis]|uniref:hypothetical protein n=1 Tax=Lysinibacillus fusiformis TaxID=28031 RepID=UPI000D398628|nr:MULTISPECIES: hypothetical protein [Lysinibacillus]MED4669798.1 hypothetical protein [Lysinibacillus fusiformis]QAS55708.1 hypothetical protein LSP_04570 [Lysinibacillus sphaericus]GED64061.1 hypothetical protein LFU01_25130 [Lysinibacillus fusiformis]
MAIEFRFIGALQRNKINHAQQPGRYLYKDTIQFSGNVKAAYVSLCGFSFRSDSPMKELNIRALGGPMQQDKSWVEVQIIANGANDDEKFYGDIEYTVIAELE